MKTKGARRITFEQFLTALAAVADARKTSLEAVVQQVLASQGPVSSGTRADYVKFHDDKVSSTGARIFCSGLQMVTRDICCSSAQVVWNCPTHSSCRTAPTIWIETWPAGPSARAFTHANAVQSLYTGVYARGGPSVEESSSIDLPHYLDRSEVRCM